MSGSKSSEGGDNEDLPKKEVGHHDVCLFLFS